MSIEIYEPLLDALPDATLIVSGEGTILAANRAVARRLGADPARLRGGRLGEAVAEPPEAVAAYLRACARSGEPVPGSLTLRGPGGGAGRIACRGEGALFRPRTGAEPALILLRLIPKEAAVGHFLVLNERIEQLAREIARRERVEHDLREQREWLGVTLESIGDAVIATDTGGAILFMNRTAEALTGWPQAEARGRPLAEVFRIVHEQTRQPVEGPVAQVLRLGEVVGLANHTVLLGRDGSERAIDDSAAPIRAAGGAVRGVVLVFHDVSERRALLRELHRRAEALAEADRRKDEFLAMLAHELRNPLAPVMNALYVLKATRAEIPEVAWATEIMERQVRHLARMVDDLLDVARITRGLVQLRPRRVDLATAVRQAVEAARPALDARGLELAVGLPEGPIALEADPTRLEQILGNLLSNAAKYSDPGGRIGLTAEADPDGRTVVVRVRDSGIGIAPEVLPRIFDLFMQADRSLDRTRGGLGIGLTLVRSLVAQHGGTVTARSDGPGRGSEFEVRLPRAAPAEPGPDRDGREGPAGP